MPRLYRPGRDRTGLSENHRSDVPVPWAMMTTAYPLTRRAFLTDLGRGAVALTVVGIAGCAPAASGSSAAGCGVDAGPTTGWRVEHIRRARPKRRPPRRRSPPARPRP